MPILRRIICAMSGGVDSCVAALLLKKKGYNVAGVFMKNWDLMDETGKCYADTELEDAKWVCKKIDIPLYQVNFVKEYWNEVFMNLMTEYQSGLTPNPDILCNKYIKFDAFFKHATKHLGAEAIATGHYARTSYGEDWQHYDERKGVRLLKALDTVKDQTFYLSQVSQEALRKTIFPLGEFTKAVVKQIACSAGFEKISKKKESMGICFIGERKYQKFIKEYIESKSGHFINIETGKIIGSHEGIHLWTLGQRIHLESQLSKFFVVEKIPGTQDILVAPGTNHPSLFAQTFFTSQPHWIHSPPRKLLQDLMFDCLFLFQHADTLSKCTLTLGGNHKLIVSLDKPKRALTPGQYAVFYDGEECLGSAKIIAIGPSLYTLNYNNCRTEIQENSKS